MCNGVIRVAEVEISRTLPQDLREDNDYLRRRVLLKAAQQAYHVQSTSSLMAPNIQIMEDNNCPTCNPSELAQTVTIRPKGTRCPANTGSPPLAVNYADISQPISAGNAPMAATNLLPCLFLDVDALLGRHVSSGHGTTVAALVKAPGTAPTAAVVNATAAAGAHLGRCQVMPVNVSDSDSLKLGNSLLNSGSPRWGRSLVDEDRENDIGAFNDCGSRVRGYANRADAGAAPRRQTLSGFDPVISDATGSTKISLTAAEAKTHTMSTAAAAPPPPTPRQCTVQRTEQNGVRALKRTIPGFTTRPGARRFLSAMKPYFALYAFSSSFNCNIDGSDKSADEWVDLALDLIDPLKTFPVHRCSQWPSATPTHGSGLQGCASQPCQARSLAQLVAAFPRVGVGAASADTVIVTCASRDLYGVLSDNVIQVVPYDSSSKRYDDVLDHIAAILVRHRAQLHCKQSNNSTCCHSPIQNNPGIGLKAGFKSANGKVRHVLEQLGLSPGPIEPSGVANQGLLSQSLAAASSATLAWCNLSRSSKRQGSNEGSCDVGRVVAATGAAATTAAAAAASSRRWQRVKRGSRSPPEARSWLSAIPEDSEGEDQLSERQESSPQWQQQKQIRPKRVPPSPTAAFNPSSNPMALRQLIVIPQALPLPQP
ncbi:hypothetical protein VaNZ11_006045, partial [Volvox africanus]